MIFRGALVASAALVASTTLAAPSTAATHTSRSYGVTVDTVRHLDSTIVAIRHLPHRPTVRVVLDVDRAHPADVSAYRRPIVRLARSAKVMAELVDSSDLRHISSRGVRARTKTALHAFGRHVSIWEVGNEVNGNWTGRRRTVAAKVNAAYRVVHSAGGRTALTLFYNHSCGDGSELGPLAWSRRYLPRSERRGMDYVLLSYYEDSCHHRRPSRAEWRGYFGKLHALFPNAKVGFGEIGMAHPATRRTHRQAVSLIRHYYRLRLHLPYYVRGCFWWYFAEDMVPFRSSSLWRTLARAIR